MYCMHERGETERSGAYALSSSTGECGGLSPVGGSREGGGRAVVLIILPCGQHRERGAGVAVAGRLEASVGVDVVD